MDRADELKSLFQEIERRDFEFEISVESGFERVISRIAGHKAVREIISIVRADESFASARTLLDRIRRLSVVSVDQRYRNQNDSALTAYLLILAVSAPKYLRVGLRLVGLAANLWLARRTASMLNKAQGMQSQAFEAYYMGGSAAFARVQNDDLNNATTSYVTEWTGLTDSAVGLTVEGRAHDTDVSKNSQRYLSALAAIGPRILTEASDEDANVSDNLHQYLSALATRRSGALTEKSNEDGVGTKR
jgi:hypothetical protein